MAWRWSPFGTLVCRRVLIKSPCVLRGGAAHWPALERWTPNYLTEIYAGVDLLLSGDLTVTRPTCKMNFSAYMNYVCSAEDRGAAGRLYASFFQPLAQPELKSDWEHPEFENQFLNMTVEAVNQYHRRFGWLLISPKGGVASKHTDLFATYAWNAVIWGQKHVRVWSPQDTKGLPVLSVTLNPGDIIYIPPLWPHMVVNNAPTLAVTFNGITRSQLPGLQQEVDRDPDGWKRYWRIDEGLAQINAHLGVET